MHDILSNFSVPQSFSQLRLARVARLRRVKQSSTDLKIFISAAETPNNFCPSRFSQVCPDFAFLQNSVSRFIVQISVADEKI